MIGIYIRLADTPKRTLGFIINTNFISEVGLSLFTRHFNILLFATLLPDLIFFNHFVLFFGHRL